MFAFHLTWDLGFFGLIPANVPFSRPVMIFGHVIAITFLALVGASLVLATRKGIDWRAYGRRLATIVVAATAITAGTIYLFPDSFIFFGILHCIAVSSVLALAFLRAPPWVAFAVAAGMAAAPFFVALPGLDNLLGWSLGLSAHEPRSNDWRPLMPWGGATIAGVGLMRLALSRGLPAWLENWRGGGRVSSALSWGGRHSLLVYLAALVIGPIPAASVSEEALFQQACETSCATAKVDIATCRALCGCVRDSTQEASLWRPMMDNRLTSEQSQTVDQLTRQCAPKR
jgi:uncharacterized membrane protein